MSESVVNVVDENNSLDNEFNENLSSYKFIIRTVQASAFRTLIEALKEYLN